MEPHQLGCNSYMVRKTPRNHSGTASPGTKGCWDQGVLFQELWNWTGVGKCPSSTSPNYILGIFPLQILQGDVKQITKNGHFPTPVEQSDESDEPAEFPQFLSKQRWTLAHASLKVSKCLQLPWVHTVSLVNSFPHEVLYTWWIHGGLQSLLFSRARWWLMAL